MANEFNKKKLFENCYRTIRELSKHIDYLGNLEYMEAVNPDPKRHMEFDEDEYIAGETIKDSVKRIYLSLLSATDQLNLPSLRESLIKEFAKYDGKESKIDLMPWFDTASSPAIELLERYLAAIAVDIETDEIVPEQKKHRSTVDEIRTFLSAAGFLLNHLKIVPKKEQDIHIPLYANLKAHYPSAKSRYTIAKPNKDYQIDIMLCREKIGIELKFSKSENDVKNHMDELYADMAGYQTKDDETRFFALMYMDKPYISKETIMESLEENKCPVSWEVIPVIGPVG